MWSQGFAGHEPPANLITATDPFPEGDNFPNDSTLQCNILNSWLQSVAPGATLLDVCSYPSIGNGGNANPFDCVTGGSFPDTDGDAEPDSIADGPAGYADAFADGSANAIAVADSACCDRGAGCSAEHRWRPD